ncbi:pentapeptide repeat-containing protein [Micromonospora sp. NBC_01796]|uniref:pentapeptide repeat-containing protein n=1 Tax=Micromonospora sp. NBC_01796 TaxID=2975987 RepID=UPI002DD94AED|nr:pentapeptide repeat-containing protein [Micromonospora sp. NBC_01796]WSA84687.1 pentapeptide repeat-containing protein [Micromonospora sp. NBC_01796]
MVKTIEGETFRNEDWYGDEFTDSTYVGCTFLHVDLMEASTRGTVFQDCTFGNVQFNASRHTDSAFLRCTFKRCNLFEAEFTGCKFVGSTFTESDLRPLRVFGGDWSFVGLSGADLRGVRFEGVRMREIDLTAANCAEAAIVNVDLSGAQLHHANLVRCDLRGSDLSALDPSTTQLTGAIIDPAQAVVIAQTLGLEIR